MQGALNALLSRFNGIFVKDKFEAEFKNALKRRNLTVSEKISDNVYEISDGNSSYKAEISEIRREFERNSDTEIIDEYVLMVEKECDMEKRMASFTNGQAFLRFVVMRDRDVPQEIISADFIDGMKRVMVYTSDDLKLHYLDESYLKKWAVPREVVFSVADRNMCKLLEKAEIEDSQLCDGVKALEFNLPSKRLATAMMLCNDFRRVVYSHIGAKFLVVAPSDESLLVLENITNNILETLGNVIVKKYKNAERPLTTDVMLFTSDNVQIAGRFAVRDDSSAADAGRSL